MKVQFFINFHTKYGEGVYICGNCKELGNNEPGNLKEMKYFNFDFWTVIVDIDITTWKLPLSYTYYFKNNHNEWIPEYTTCRNIQLTDFTDKKIIIYDTWIDRGAIENVFYTTPFKKIFLPKPVSKLAPNKREIITHLFKIKAPLLKQDEVVCLLGNKEALHNWNTANPLLMAQECDEWQLALDLKNTSFPVSYKYGIFNTVSKTFLRYEEGENRFCNEAAQENTILILQEGFIRLPNNRWKGAGVAIPVFSLRSASGLGVGEFNDIKLLTDWATVTGLKLIQLLPLNDTSATFTWKDSYPYAAISAFALHPIYLNLETVATKPSASILASINKKRNTLNKLDTVDYETVLAFKLTVLQKIFELNGKQCLESEDYITFFYENEHWLKPYAAFCFYRDGNGTSVYADWKAHSTFSEADVDTLFSSDTLKSGKVYFYCFLQYHLHLQLKEAVKYAHEKGIAIKGDIPIGVYRNGCDTWMAPTLYHMELQAGAPPDDFAVNGQNWGFPTYNWQQMQTDGFAWWKQRFEQMSFYFDAFRIDHILGFFRIWSIPLASTQGIMGHFDPCLPVYENEFRDSGIAFDASRFCKPFINDIILHQLFNSHVNTVKEKFFSSRDGFNYTFLPAFDTLRKLATWLAAYPDDPLQTLKEPLCQLHANLILFEENINDQPVYHFRFNMENTSSFQALPHDQQEKLKVLYNDYFFTRQNDFWRRESLKKLPALKAATNMLICGEDLGMVPDCVPQVMKELGILSLEIQRMPKQIGQEFFDPATAPYLSVVSPSTHDMSTIRGWWEEDRQITQRFFNNMLHMHGNAPFYCEPWINYAIVLQHLESPAMWSIFQLQDLMGIDGNMRREHAADERINIPADPDHYWQYRMHLTLEQLLEEKFFNKTLQQMLSNSGR